MKIPTFKSNDDRHLFAPIVDFVDLDSPTDQKILEIQYYNYAFAQRHATKICMNYVEHENMT